MSRKIKTFNRLRRAAELGLTLQELAEHDTKQDRVNLLLSMESELKRLLRLERPCDGDIDKVIQWLEREREFTELLKERTALKAAS